MNPLTRRALAAAAVAVLGAACGGGGSDDSAATTTAPPTTAAVSTTTTVATTLPATTTTPPLQLTNNAKVSTAGVGPIRVGMTLEEAERVSGVVLVPDADGDDLCRFHTPDRGAEGIGVMVVAGEVVRVDVWSGPVSTLSGIGIGSLASDIEERFADKLEVADHPTVDGGQVLTLIPVDEVDADKRVIWETSADGVVTTYRAGRIPYIERANGCDP